MKFIKGLLIFFGILFLIEIILLVGIYFWNPYDLWGHDDIDSTYDHPLLDESQEATLEKLGIDPEYIPERITPIMQECFVKTLGQERVDEIIAGDSPSPTDLFKAKECISE